MTYSVGFVQFNEILHSIRVVWVLVRMHSQRKFTIGFFYISLCSVISHTKNFEWVEALDTKRHHSHVVKEPKIPQECTDYTSVDKSFLENIWTSFFLLDFLKCQALWALTRGWKFFYRYISIDQRLEQIVSQWQNKHCEQCQRKEIEGRIIII